MCGVVGLVSKEPVNQRLYDALLLLQHRGQDAAGIGTLDGLTFHSYTSVIPRRAAPAPIRKASPFM